MDISSIFGISNNNNNDSSSSNGDGSDKSNSVRVFVASLIFNVAVAAIIFLVFCLLRPRLRRVYAPRTYAVEKHKRSDPISSGLFAWIPAIMRVPDEEIIRRSGLDTYMFLRGIRSMFIIFSVISVLSAGSILPINILGSKGFEGLTSLSISNVDNKSSRLWVHVGFFALVVVWTMWNITGELRIYTHLRMWWLTHPDHATKASASTILVTDIPKNLVNDESRLSEMFDMLPGGVRQIFVNRTSKELANTVAKRDKLAHKLEKLLTRYAIECTKKYEKAQKTGDMYVQPKRPITFKSGSRMMGEKVETIEYLASEIAMCNHFIAQSTKDMSSFTRESSALVMFNKQIAAHMAAQAVLDYKPFSMGSVTADVNPSDIIWSNLRISPWSRRIRGYLSFIITLAITFWWSVITAAVSGLVQANSLTQLDAFKWLANNNIALGIFSGIVPSLVIAVLMQILPSILRVLLRLEGTPRHSLVKLRLLHRLFFFQVLNVYLVNIFASSILNIVTNYFGGDKDVIKLIQEDVPKSATNILTYVLLLSFVGAAKEILQGLSLTVRYLLPMIVAKTPRSMARAEKPKEFEWATAIPTHTLIFLMGFSYSFIAPIVNWFVAVYFGLFYIIYRYQFLYVYNDTKWVTGGLSYPKTIKQMLVAIYISEVYMILMMLARVYSSADAIMRVVVSVGILMFTIAVHLYINDIYMPAINYLPIKKAADVERNPLLASEFPDVLDTEDDQVITNNAGSHSRLSIDQRKKRNWIYAMYSSLVPAFVIKQMLRTFPRLLGPTRITISEEELALETSAPPFLRSRTTDKRLSMFDQRPLNTSGSAELAQEFSTPELRAKPVCNLWVPLGNPRLFSRLLWEVEYYGQGTILVITQGTDITHKYKVVTDFDFVLESAEVSDKTELLKVQRQRPAIG
ncbi:phosphate metabolism protein 7 [Coemansia sp. Benny D115]|nr:phosphate metabolism protein 7 [Coemansia sp. Benny D115]